MYMTRKKYNWKNNKKRKYRLIIITVHCFIINSLNQILLTQRSLTKNRGEKWEETHGGLKAGETSIRGIQRELKEEIGIEVQIN